MRSLLIAPGDDAAKLEAAIESGADAVVIDLDTTSGARGTARTNAARLLKEADTRPGAPSLMIRVSPVESDETDHDLDAVMDHGPFAILLPNAGSGASVQRLSAKLAVREADLGLADGATRIIAIVDTAAALLVMASFRGCSRRLIGLAWDAEALRGEMGADGADASSGPLRLARGLTLIGAAAAGVAAIDAASPIANAPDVQRADALAARRNGFCAKFALDARQAAIVNSIFAAKRKGGT